MNGVLLGLKAGAQKVGSAIANSRTLQVMLVSAIIIAIIYFKGKADGKAVLAKYKVVDVEGKEGVPAGFDKIANDLVDSLYKGFSDWLVTPSYREAYYTVMMSYTDDMIRVVYNLYNSKYGITRSKTLTQEIQDTWYGHNTEILAKLRTLGLN